MALNVHIFNKRHPHTQDGEKILIQSTHAQLQSLQLWSGVQREEDVLQPTHHQLVAGQIQDLQTR